MIYKTGQQIRGLTEDEFKVYHKECVIAAFDAMKRGGNDGLEFSQAARCVLVRVRNSSDKTLNNGKDR